MKNKDLINLLEGLNNLTNLKGAKFSYFVSKNKRIIKDEIENLTSSLKPTKEEKEHEDKRIEICNKYCLKKEDGTNDITIIDESTGNGIFNFGINATKVKEKLDILNNEYKEVLKLKEDKQKEFNLLLEEVISDDTMLHKIKLSDIPNDITEKQMNNIFEIVIEDDNIK